MHEKSNRTEIIAFTVSPEEKQRIVRQAQRLDMSVSRYMRIIALRKEQKEYE